MTAKQQATFDLHPDDLIDRARGGELTEAEQTRLDEHLAACDACVFEVAALRDFESEALSDEEDVAASSRIAAGALAALDATSDATDLTVEREARRAPVVVRFAAAAGLVLALGIGAAAAAYWSGLIGDDAPAVDAPAKRDRTRHAPAVPPAVEPTPERIAPGMEPDPERKRTPRVRRDPRAPAPVPTPPTAADLLARANAARHAGDYEEAADLYRTLQRHHPKSREQQVSRVAAGRLLLDHLDDPEAALTQFETYLDASSKGTLAEEARVGRAQALQRLGRHSAERSAWKDLLTHHPASPHAERARKRLDQLDGEE